MVDSLNEDMHRRIEAECEAFSLAQHLDSEIQRELRAHMEDKVLAYLNGKEVVTFDDALILTRAHFGDPAVLKKLMSGVHVVEAYDSLARRLVAAMFVGTLLSIVFMFTGDYVERTLAWFGIPVLPKGCLNWVCSLLTLWLCLSYWQRQLLAGNPPWFAKWNAFRMASCLAIVLLLRCALDLHFMYYRLAAMSDATPEAPVGITIGWPIVYAFYVFPGAYLFLGCLMWLWWCDRPPRMWQNLVATTLVFFLYEGVFHRGLSPLFMIVYAQDIAMQTGTNFHQFRNTILNGNLYVLAVSAVVAWTALLGYVATCGVVHAWRNKRYRTVYPASQVSATRSWPT